MATNSHETHCWFLRAIQTHANASSDPNSVGFFTALVTLENDAEFWASQRQGGDVKGVLKEIVRRDPARFTGLRQIYRDRSAAGLPVDSQSIISAYQA